MEIVDAGFIFVFGLSSILVFAQDLNLEVAMPRLRAENPLIHFVLREIPLTKTKTTRF